jgi:hypothetical protein
MVPLLWQILLLSALVTPGCSTVPRSFHPADRISPDSFSHQALETALKRHVLNGVVEYPGLSLDREFAAYVRDLNRVDPMALPSREDRLAFWINAYNAFAIQGILDGYSPRTLWGRYRYFIGREYRVGGETINLYDLERKLLIPDFREPRIHFAIVCASRSCPSLHAEAYTRERLEAQLEQGAREFVNDPARNRFDRDRKVAVLSMIFQWYEDDFAAEAGSLLSYVKRYVADPAVARDLHTYRIEFMPYDWTLNGIALKP